MTVRTRRPVVRRARVVLVVAATLLMSVTPAKDAAAHSYQRERTISKHWAPTYGAGWVGPIGEGWNEIGFEFGWWDWKNQIETWGQHRALKFKAYVGHDYAFQYLTDWGVPIVDTNIPSNATPEASSLFGEEGDPDDFGISIADANYLSSYVSYNATVYVDTEYTESVAVSWGAAVSTHKDHQEICGWGPGPAICNFSDYETMVIQPRNFVVSTSSYRYRAWGYEMLGNDDLEDTWWPWFASVSGQNAAWYCDGTGYMSSCYYEMNQGTAGLAAVHTDVLAFSQNSATDVENGSDEFTRGDIWTMEAAVRCRPGVAYCTITLAIWGLAGSIDEPRYQAVNIPADNQWYNCRVDKRHGFSTPYSTNHDYLRAQIYLNYGGNFDVDRLHLGRETIPKQNGAGDSGWVSDGPMCFAT